MDDITLPTQTNLTASDTKPIVQAEENFEGSWPFAARYCDAAGFKQHYIEEGEGEETLLLLHGEPTWSYLFRKLIPVWSQRNRVIALDHMGFGKSAAPQDRTYYLQDHTDNLEAFALALDLKNLTLVMHDFGGPAGMGFAIRHPERVKRLISVNGPTPTGQPDLLDQIQANVAISPWFQWIMEAEKEGTLDQTLGQLGYNMLSTLKLNGFVDNSVITESWIRAYSAPFPNPASTLGPLGWAKGFATGSHRFDTPDEETRNLLAKKPALALWGKEDKTLNSKHFLPLFRQAFPHGLVYEIIGAGHYSPEDAPDVIAGKVAEFIQSFA